MYKRVVCVVFAIWLCELFILHTSASAAIIRRIITYQSSVSTNIDGPLDLKAELNYNSIRNDAPIAVVMHGYSPSTGNFDNVRPPAQRLRDKGFFVVSVALRGRDGSDGVRDSGGVEIFDIYDAVEAVKSSYARYVRPDIVYITGYSGGGGNTMSALTKFPDYFTAGAGFFGISDYGYDPIDGWYFNGASSSHQQIMNTDIGNPTTGAPLVLDRYMARASNLASKNNPYSEVHLFVNYNETICPLINDTSYRDNAIAAESYAGEFSNITVHTGYSGEYEDFDGDGINDPDEMQYWPHQIPTADQQNAAEAWFMDRLLNVQIPQPVMDDQDTIFVAGYVKTKPFFLWLGDGQNATAQLDYSLSSENKTFAMELLSSDVSVEGVLTVETADMTGPELKVELNGIEIASIEPGEPYIFDRFANQDTLVIKVPAQEPFVDGDFDDDRSVTFSDYAYLALYWGCNDGTCNGYDITGDDCVDSEDLLAFLENWLVGKQATIYSFGLNSDPGWAREGQWQFGEPLGLGGFWFGNPDPITAYSGENVFGVNLSGDYEVSVGGPYSLTAGPFDLERYADIILKFARWLNSDEPGYVSSKVEVYDGVQWHIIWENSDFIMDNDWQLIEYDISEFVDNRENVYVRWSYEIQNIRAWPLSGWNLDDVELLGVKTPSPQ